MKNVALPSVTPLPADYELKSVRESSVLGLVIYHSECGKGIVIAKARDCWTISFEQDEYSGDYSPIVCYQQKLLTSTNPGFDSYMVDYIRVYYQKLV